MTNLNNNVTINIMRAKDRRNAKIRKLHAEGNPSAAIAKFYSVTPARISQILKIKKGDKTW